MRRPIVLLSALSLAGLALVGCGDTEGDDESTTENSSGGGSSSVTVEAHDIEFGEDSYDADAGSVTFAYVNEGAIPHTLVIDGVDDFKLEVESSGDEAEGSVELEAGTYTLYCDVPGHRDAGMEATLEVG